MTDSGGNSNLLREIAVEKALEDSLALETALRKPALDLALDSDIDVGSVT